MGSEGKVLFTAGKTSSPFPPLSAPSFYVAPDLPALDARCMTFQFDAIGSCFRGTLTCRQAVSAAQSSLGLNIANQRPALHSRYGENTLRIYWTRQHRPAFSADFRPVSNHGGNRSVGQLREKTIFGRRRSRGENPF